jgi:predicted alpha/beta hydrolase family esterase
MTATLPAVLVASPHELGAPVTLHYYAHLDIITQVAGAKIRSDNL